MGRPMLTEATKQCREDLRVLTLWRLSKGRLVKRVALKTWLAGSVDSGWGLKGRPRDLGTPQEEADSTIDHLLQQGNCQQTGEPGHEKVRLVKPVQTLKNKIARLGVIEEKVRQEAAQVLENGGQIRSAEDLPRSWEAQAMREVGERLTGAVARAVVEQLKNDPAPKAGTAETQSVHVSEEPQQPPSDSSTLSSSRVLMLPVDKLQPNDWNPNIMTEEQEGELLEEIRRNKRPCHNILVRPLGDGLYQIVDGEHSWAASKKAGLTEVPCEVIQVDDFEAMRLTFVRNLQGTRDPLRTGRLFQCMLKHRNLPLTGAVNSQRQFAHENNINEATLRNYLLYAEAAEVRNAYAPETADETIGKLSVAKVRLYLRLPKAKRDQWLDHGALSDEANQILEETGKEAKATKERADTGKPAATGRKGASGEAVVATEPDEEPCEETAVEGAEDEEGDEGQQDVAAGEDDQPEEPLSREEQEEVDNVLTSYKEGRTLVRQKILGGLGAHPDAVAFFRRMIKGGS